MTCLRFYNLSLSSIQIFKFRNPSGKMRKYQHGGAMYANGKIFRLEPKMDFFHKSLERINSCLGQARNNRITSKVYTMEQKHFRAYENDASASVLHIFQLVTEMNQNFDFFSPNRKNSKITTWLHHES